MSNTIEKLLADIYMAGEVTIHGHYSLSYEEALSLARAGQRTKENLFEVHRTITHCGWDMDKVDHYMGPEDTIRAECHIEIAQKHPELFSETDIQKAEKYVQYSREMQAKYDGKAPRG